MPGWRTGPHLAEAFIEVLDHVNIVLKVCIRHTTTKHRMADNVYCCRSVGSLMVMPLIMTILLSISNGCYDIGY